jgi:deoxyribodipyrimidine photo-lyase
VTAALVWFRRDLRLSDNGALAAALTGGAPVVPVFIWSPEEEAPWQPGAASRWWLHQSLEELRRALLRLGSNLIIRVGPAREALLRLAEETGARSIYWSRLYDPALVVRDRELKVALRERGLAVKSFPGNLLFEPWTIQNGSGEPFRVFTPFWKACLRRPAPAPPTMAPDRIPAPASWPRSEAIPDLDLEPKSDWAGGLSGAWTPGESGAWAALTAFRDRAMGAYSSERDRPDHPGTSHLSPHLHFGEISPRQVWHAARGLPGSEPYLRQIVWREFAHHLLFHYPRTDREPLRPEFGAFPWRMDEAALQAWTAGKTGYPLVDAGMRELWHTGWMHNRVRMVVGSFLVKHLLIDWREGAAWFWDTLVDADLANNTFGWQWTAGCGADAAPYFRIFHPVLQGEKFDPDGDYVRRWVPELASLPAEYIHKPWDAPKPAGGYPARIVIHEAARARALKALAEMRGV